MSRSTSASHSGSLVPISNVGGGGDGGKNAYPKASLETASVSVAPLGRIL